MKFGADRRALALWTAIGIAVASAGCSAAPRSDPSSVGTASAATTTVASTSAAPTSETSGLVDIGDGRRIFMDCRGAGTPTVVVISGKGGAADDWELVLEPNDPIRNDPSDLLSAGKGKVVTSPDAVLPQVATFTRICAYDRPNTRPTGPDQSTPRAQPHSVELDVADLHQLLLVSGEPPPYVLVGHSYGGAISELYARRYPEQITGLVMVDALTSRMRSAMTPAELKVWDGFHRQTSPDGGEAIEVIDALDRLDAAGPLPDVPAIVLSADKPIDPSALPPALRDFFLRAWTEAQALAASYLKANQVTETHSGHFIPGYSPTLVVAAIRDVVSVARGRAAGATSPTAAAAPTS